MSMEIDRGYERCSARAFGLTNLLLILRHLVSMIMLFQNSNFLANQLKQEGKKKVEVAHCTLVAIGVHVKALGNADAKALQRDPNPRGDGTGCDSLRR